MAQIRNKIRFLLNSQLIELGAISPTMTLLDYLRLDRRLKGTKEGCAEGDCGACTVLVGRLVNSEIIYETVNSCIRFIGSLDGCHVVTIEHLKRKDGSLHPVQQAMVDHHGSQCGFCTPGIVMSLYALWMRTPNPQVQQIETALQGNLCRCTGYEPIIKAAQNISAIDGPENDPLLTERAQVKDQLFALNDKARIEMEDGDDLLLVPSSVSDLADARKNHPNSTIVAGSTDVGLWVTKDMRQLSPVIFISHLEALHRKEVSENSITIGACVTYSEFQNVVREHFPTVAEYWNRIGGEQVRNMGTIGGNVANGSPIGDTPPWLIALGATVTLRCGDERRTLPVEGFFIDYGKQDRLEGDFIEALTIPFPGADDHVATYKISKRRDEDISAVSCAFRLTLQDDVVSDIVIAFGGMAATPKRAQAVESALVGEPWTEATIQLAGEKFQDDFTPLSDWRASADYRLLVARNLLRRFFFGNNRCREHSPQTRNSGLRW